MARLESTARAGYYPTPERVTAAILRHLTAQVSNSRSVIRILDPCAGTGEAAATIACGLGAESYGIELNEERAALARSRLDHVLASSAFSVRLANAAFSCLYLNPPYSEDQEKGRLEHAFLTSMTRALCPGGLLVYLIPQRRLARSARYLASHYSDFLAYRFPDPEYRAFGQMVLFARRKRSPLLDHGVQVQLEAWSETELEPLPDVPACGSRFVLPALPTGSILFAPLFFDIAQAAHEARRRGVWAQPQLAERLWPRDAQPVRPLMPLRKGHLALLIAAGMLNNVLLEQEGQRVLVKGCARKELISIDSADEETLIEREVLRTSVMLLDLSSGVLQTIEDGVASADEDEVT